MRTEIARRRLLGALALGGALLTVQSAAQASGATLRIAVLDYGLAETLLALGTDPIALPDTPGWAKWVVEPPLPPGVTNLGAEQEINLELLASLRPDLILTTPFLDDLNPTLARLAPCERLTIYEEGGPGPYVRAEIAMRRIGAIIGAPPRADAYLAASAAQFAAERGRLTTAPAAPLLLANFLDPRHVRAFAANSLWQDVLDRLGRENAWRRSTTYWGFSTVGIEALAAVPDNTVLVTFASLDPDILTVLDTSSLWRRLPFVQQRRILRLPSALPFGAVPSACRFARLLTDGLTGTLPT